MLSKDTFGIDGDDAWKERLVAKRRRDYTIQAVLLLVLFALLASAVMNVSENLEARHIRSGFAFISNPAGFDVGETAIAFSSFDPMWKAFAAGILNTIKISLYSIVTATLMGVVVGLMRLSRHPMLRFLGAAHVEVYRNIPLIVLFLAVYLTVTELLPSARGALHIGDWVFLSKSGLQYAEPVQALYATISAFGAGVIAALATYKLLLKRLTSLIASLWGLLALAVVAVVVWVSFGAIGGWVHPEQTRFALSGGGQFTPEFLALWLGLTLFTSAAIAEIVRAGVLAVRPQQWEAGLALGLTRAETVSYVIFPQSMRLVIPPLASQYMNLTKNSSLAVIVGYPDLVNIGNTAINVSAQALEVICIIMMVYLTLNLIISVVMNALNARVMRAPQ